MDAIGPEAAYIACERAAVGEVMAARDPWRARLPGPQIPRGLMSNDLAPYDLRELGFAEGEMVCAAWLAPPSEEALAQISSEAQAVGEAMRALEGLGRGCGCVAAQQLAITPWISRCRGAARRGRCELDPAIEAQMAERFDALQAELAETRLPRRHWRLVGPVGRTGRFRALHASFASRLGIAGEGYVPGETAPGFGATPTIDALLQLEGVQVVLRMDSGRALLIVRELEDLLIFDLFEHPGSAERWGPHFEVLDAVSYAQLTERLALPSARSGPRPTVPTLIYDHDMLTRLDAVATAAWALEGQLEPTRGETWKVQPPVFVRYRFESRSEDDEEGAAPDQIPREQALELFAVPTEAGRAWLSLGEGGGLADRAAAMAETREPYVFSRRGPGPEYALRGSEMEAGLFDGARSFPRLVGALSAADVAAVEGNIAAFTLRIPGGPLPGELESRPGLGRLRTHLSTRGHTLEGTLEGTQEGIGDASFMRLRLAPGRGR